MDTLISFFISKDFFLACFAGLVSAFVFYRLMRSFKPRIKVSPYILEEKKNGEVKYYFKFYNASSFNLENVSINLSLMEDYHHGTGRNYTSRNMELHWSKFNFLVGTRKKNKEIHDNCVQMRIKEDLKKEWNEDREWLQLSIDATNATSGRRAVLVVVYKDPKNTIKKGRFDSGENFKII